PELDERFIIKASDLELARAWLGDTAPGLLGLYDPNTWSLYRVAVRHGEVLVRRDSGKVSAELVVAAVETTVPLAGAGRRLAGQGLSVAVQLGGRPARGCETLPLDGLAAFFLDRAGVRLDVAVHRRRAGLRRQRTDTIVRAHASSGLPPGSARRREAGPCPTAFAITGAADWRTTAVTDDQAVAAADPPRLTVRASSVAAHSTA